MNFKKITNCRVLPKKYTLLIRLIFIGALGVILFKPILFVATKADIVLNHTDTESGIVCILQRSLHNNKLECSKDQNVGLDLREIPLTAKEWVYKTEKETFIFERKGYSEGIEITVKGKSLDKDISSQIKYND